MLEEIARTMKRGEDFGFETTLSGRGHLNLVRRLKKHSYAVHFFYLWVPNVDIALLRIRARVAMGGHDVPETVVRRRFERSMRNFLLLYQPLSDSWTLYDNTRKVPKEIASEQKGQLRIVETRRYNQLMSAVRNP